MSHTASLLGEGGFSIDKQRNFASETLSVPEDPSTPYFPALDGLRAIAILLVLGSHALPAYLPWGWMGVQIFFVLSGFLISGILLDSRGKDGRYRAFYARRALRIFPLYYFVLLVCLAVLLITRGHGPRDLWLWFVYLQNFAWFFHAPLNDLLYTGHGRVFAALGHLWSLAVEEQFYIFWPPLVFAIGNRRRLAQICLVLIAVRWALAPLLQWKLPVAMLQAGFIYRLLPTQWDGFLWGTLFALWLRRGPGGRARNSPDLPYAGLVAAMCLVLAVGLLAGLHHWPLLPGGQDVFAYTSGFQAVAGMPLMNLFSLGVLVGVTQPGTWIFRLCHLPAMRALGRISYGFYVYHYFIFLVTRSAVNRVPRMRNLPHSDFLVFAITFSVTLVTAWISFRLLERPFLQLKNRFKVTPPKKAPVTS